MRSGVIWLTVIGSMGESHAGVLYDRWSPTAVSMVPERDRQYSDSQTVWWSNEIKSLANVIVRTSVEAAGSAQEPTALLGIEKAR